MTPSPRSNASHGYVDKQNVSLKEYFDMRFNALEKALSDAEKAHDEHQEEITKSIDDRFRAQEKAVVVALQSNEKRLDSMNEFRETLRDQNKTFITRADHDALIISYQKDIESLDDKISSLNEFRAELKGKASQSQLNITFIFTLISFIIGIAGLILGFFGK